MYLTPASCARVTRCGLQQVQRCLRLCGIGWCHMSSHAKHHSRRIHGFSCFGFRRGGASMSCAAHICGWTSLLLPPREPTRWMMWGATCYQGHHQCLQPPGFCRAGSIQRRLGCCTYTSDAAIIWYWDACTSRALVHAKPCDNIGARHGLTWNTIMHVYIIEW